MLILRTVHFDFSDWPFAELNPRTTSYVYGISEGTLVVMTDVGERKIHCDGRFDTRKFESVTTFRLSAPSSSLVGTKRPD